MKTRRSAAKSFKVSANGKIKRRKAFRSHILTSKSTKRKRHLRKIRTRCDNGSVQSPKIFISIS